MSLPRLLSGILETPAKEMPSVTPFRCPGCHRALRLPALPEVRTGQCPLCRTIFDLPAHIQSPEEVQPISADVLPPPVPVPDRPWRPPSPADTPPLLPWQQDSPDHAQDEQETPSCSTYHNQLRSAATYLLFMAILGLLQTVPCGCCQWVVVLELLSWINAGEWLIGVFVVRLVILLIILNTASSLGYRQQRWWPLLSAWLAIGLACKELLVAVGTVAWFLTFSFETPRSFEAVPILLGFIVVNLLVAFSGLMGGTKVLQLYQDTVLERSRED